MIQDISGSGSGSFIVTLNCSVNPFVILGLAVLPGRIPDLVFH